MAETEAKPNVKSLLPGVFFGLLPFVLVVPYRWFVFVYARDSIVTPTIGEEHQRVHLGVWFIFTMFPVAVLCFGVATVSFVRLRRNFRVAYVLAAMSGAACAFTAFVLISPFLGL